MHVRDGQCDLAFVARCSLITCRADVTEAALNLFINSNAQGLLQEMKPDIKKKMVQKTRNFVNNLFSRIPYDMWMLQ